MENKKCLKPPTSDVSDLLINEAGFDPVISENWSDGSHNRDWCEFFFTVAVAVFCTKSRSSTPNVDGGASGWAPVRWNHCRRCWCLLLHLDGIAGGPKHVQTQSILRFPQKMGKIQSLNQFKSLKNPTKWADVFHHHERFVRFSIQPHRSGSSLHVLPSKVPRKFVQKIASTSIWKSGQIKHISK